MSNFREAVCQIMHNKFKFKSIYKYFASIMLFFYFGETFAGGSDLLAGTEAELLATLQGTGKKYIYLAEGILSIAAYIKTKNLLVLTGIIVVAMFLNIVIKFASGDMGF